jgi:predicted Zn-dependent protease
MDKLALLTEILTQNPSDTFARYGLAMELISQNRIEEGLAEFDKLIAQSPDYVPAYQMSAQTLARLNRTEQALERLHAGIAAANRTGNQHALAEMDALRDELSGADA